MGIGEGRLLHVAQSLFHDHVPAKELRAADRVDQPAARPARVGRDASRVGRRDAGLGVPVDGRVRRGGCPATVANWAVDQKAGEG